MKLVFMGTPDFAVPSLETLVTGGHQVAGVFTQPDKPQNRGMHLTPSPVKEAALAHGIPVYQPRTLRDGEALEILQTLDPELIVVAAYGKILPKEILDLPKYGCINVHSSLLPRYRGAAPINWAMLRGEQETGVTIMCMAEGLDTGDILTQTATPIDPEETVEELRDRLALLGAELLGETVEAIARGTVTRTPQDESLASYAPMLDRSLSPLDFTKPARQVVSQIRALLPWPATTMVLGGVTVKVFSARETGVQDSRAPGTLFGDAKQGLHVVCGDGQVLSILELQAPGKKRMGASDYLRGHPLG